jgi:TolB-like protein/DNA-binding winged helix-turn-helix (wHTH) protein/cytochrome c-type biogenesis protein CcmH/NrfG
MKNSDSVFGSDLSAPEWNIFRFGHFCLDPRTRTLSRADSPVYLTPKAFDLLNFLVQNPNRLITKEELLQGIWGDTFVEEGNLTRYISHLRKALGDDAEDKRLIVTIARKGYQFTPGVTVVEGEGTPGQIATPVPLPEPLPTDTRSASEARASRALPISKRVWRIAAALAASAAILVTIAYATRWRIVGMPPPGSQKIMLAVLPFENLTGDPKKEYLADGLTEELISQLGRLNPKQLGVIARTSVMGYKHKEERLDQIGRDLSVQYVLENSLRESGNQIRLTAQLIQVKDQTHLWSQDYDYGGQDILTVQDQVAKAVAEVIQVRLATPQQAPMSQPHRVNPEAFDTYLQGYYFFEHSATDKDTEMARKYFERAIQIDPDFALAWVGLSRVRNWEAGEEGLFPTGDGQRLAHEAAQRALALDPNLPEAHSQMGRIQQYDDFDWTGADASFHRAMSLEPENPIYLRQSAELAAQLGRTEEGMKLSHRALDLDPLNPASWETLGELSADAGHLEEAMVDCKKALELDASTWFSRIWISRIYLMQGRPKDALREAGQIDLPEMRLRISAIAYSALGRREESNAALAELIAKYRASGPYSIAEVFAYRNQLDEAFAWMDRASAQHDSSLPEIKIDPFVQNLHGDPRFAALLKKINLAG